jgi:sulfide:quinone oxidoreductase
MRARPHVLIAGGGVAGLETLLALRAAAGDRVEITVLAPEAKFINRSMAVDQPSATRFARGLRLRDLASDLGARWHRGRAARVDPERRVVITNRGSELPYDRLVLALGAHPEREWRSEGVLTYHGARDAQDFRRLLRQLETGRVSRVAFVKPRGPSWPLPLYELALTAASASAARGAQVELTFVTPETEPCEVFGAAAGAAVSSVLDRAGIRVYTGSQGVPSRPGRLHVSPGGRRVNVDRIVTLPRLAGPRLPGVPCDADGFIRTDAHGRVAGLEDVYAAGDATAFPIKQGGLAAQQADAVARSIASSVDARVAPRPFRPVLRGLLTAGETTRYMRAPLASAGGDGAVSERPLWWPPNRLCGRYLAPYLSHRVGGGAAMFQDAPSAVSKAIEGPRTFGELADLAPAGILQLAT